MFIMQIYSKCDNETFCAWPTCGQVSSTQFKMLFYRWDASITAEHGIQSKIQSKNLLLLLNSDMKLY